MRLNERLSKKSRRRWFETPWRTLWRNCNEEFSTETEKSSFLRFFFILSSGCYNLDNFQHNQWRKFRQMIIHFPCDKYMATIEWRHMSANTCNFNDQYIALSIDHSNTREIVPKVNFCLRVGQGVVVSHNRIWLISMPSRLFFSESYQSSQNIWPATHDFSPDGFWEMRNGIKLHPTAKYDT